MKRFFIIAAVACVALAGCTRNEKMEVSVKSEKEITFTKPILSNLSKAVGFIDNGNYPTEEDFAVYAWHCDDIYDPATAEAYMYGIGGLGLTVSHDPSINDDSAGDAGAWAPASPVYWPKFGTLTFDAYSPAELKDFATVTCDKTAGLRFADYTVAEKLEDQIDVLWSKRVYNKVSNAGIDPHYDGVDINFTHALSAIRFEAKVAGDYGSDKIIIKKIYIRRAFNKATFNQNIIDAVSDVVPTWTDPAFVPYSGTEVEYVIYENPAGLELNTSYQAIGDVPGKHNVAILIPQVFADTQSDPADVNTGVLICVDYTHVTSGGVDNDDTAIYTLASNYNGYEDSVYREITAWKAGKRYTYQLQFGLEKIYFAPDVKDWDDVTIEGNVVQ